MVPLKTHNSPENHRKTIHSYTFPALPNTYRHEYMVEDSTLNWRSDFLQRSFRRHPANMWMF
jgi:hypothetical protein